MKYEKPELTVLTSAISAVQRQPKTSSHTDSPQNNDNAAAYEDWED
jgi:hypothetical protein